MNMFKRAIVLSLCTCAILGCARIKVQYVGESFPPTSNVEMFFDINDIKRPYKNVGEVVGIAPSERHIESQEVQRRMIEKAKKEGADAVLFEPGSRTSMQTTYNSQYYEMVIKGQLLKYTD